MPASIRRIVRCALFSAFLLLLTGCHSASGGGLISVMLEEGDGFHVVGENPVRVQPGTSAVFQIEMSEGYVCIQSSDGTVYDEDSATLTVTDVRYPRTVQMRVADNPKKMKFFIENAGNGGYVGADLEQGFVYEGTIAHCYAQPKDEYRFDGWSLRHSLEQGGELLSTDLNFTYTVTESAFLFANFTRVVADLDTPDPDRETYLITYDAGEGRYNGTNVSVITFELERYHIYENCLPAKDTFVREGYQLIEYNTKADGSGEAYSLGSKIIDDYAPDEEIVLYCVWAKESDASLFSYEETGGYLTITDYRGDEDTVVIPEKIDGKTVVRIRKGAFVEKHFSTLVIPKTITVVDSGAFGCTSNFTTLYMFDNIVSIRDDSFTDLSGLRNFRLNAAKSPAFTNSAEGCFSEKWEWLVSSEKPVIVVVSGSSSLYGLNSAMLQSMVGNDYTVVNYGTNAGTSSVFYLEVLSHFLGEGDIVIHAPEIGDSTMGSTDITWRLMRGTEYYLNVWRYVDVSRYSHLFSQLSEFNTYRKSTELDYTMRTAQLNEYGDIETSDEMNSSDYFGGATIGLYVGAISGTKRESLNEAYRMLTDRGVKVYMSCAPCNRNAIPAKYLTEAAMDAYMDSIRSAVDVPVISHIRDYILGGEYMYNSDYHPNAWGRDMRTKQLYADLAAQMEKDGIPLPPMAE